MKATQSHHETNEIKDRELDVGLVICTSFAIAIYVRITKALICAIRKESLKKKSVYVKGYEWNNHQSLSNTSPN